MSADAQDLYDVIGVDKDASAKEISAASKFEKDRTDCPESLRQQINNDKTQEARTVSSQKQSNDGKVSNTDSGIVQKRHSCWASYPTPAGKKEAFQQTREDESVPKEEANEPIIWFKEEEKWELTWPLWHMLSKQERKALALKYGYKLIGELEEYITLRRAVEDSSSSTASGEENRSSRRDNSGETERCSIKQDIADHSHRQTAYGFHKTCGKPCKWCIVHGGFCKQHSGQDPSTEVGPVIRQTIFGINKTNGQPCKQCIIKGDFCKKHCVLDQDPSAEDGSVVRQPIFGINKTNGQPCKQCIIKGDFCKKHWDLDQDLSTEVGPVIRQTIFGINNTDGQPCKLCIIKGDFCKKHLGQDPERVSLNQA